MTEIIYITNGGLAGKNNIYFSDWSCKINTIATEEQIASVGGLSDLNYVMEQYRLEHPEIFEDAGV